MDDIPRLLLIYGALPSILGFGAFLVKSLLNRLDLVETLVDSKVNELRVRELLSDKVDPIREDIQELKVKLDKITDLLMRK